MLTSLTTLPTLVFCKVTHISYLMNALNNYKIETKVENMVIKISVVTVLGGWLGAFPLVLDWMQPWQEWPVTHSLIDCNFSYTVFN